MQQHFIALLLIAATAQIIGGIIAWYALKHFARRKRLIISIEVGLMFAVSALLVYEGLTTAPNFALLGLALGVLLIYFLHKLIPHIHKIKKTERLGTLAFAAMCFHEFPEGMAFGSAYIVNPVLGAATAILVAAHNIPEGAVVAIPYLLKKKINTAFKALFTTQILYIIGGILTFFLLLTVPITFQVAAMCIAAGAMFYIGFEELTVI